MKNARRQSARRLTPRTTAALPKPVTRSKVAPLTSLKAIQAQCDAYIDVDFLYDGTPIRLTVRRLKPAEQHKLDLIKAPVIPPIIKGERLEDDRPDVNNTEYRVAKAEIEHVCRNLAIYWCCPAFSDPALGGIPAMVDQKQIVDFVDGFFNHDILTLLADIAKSNPMTLEDQVNLS